MLPRRVNWQRNSRSEDTLHSNSSGNFMGDQALRSLIIIKFLNYFGWSTPVLRNGKASEYNGGRTAETIVSWLEKKTGPPAKTLETVDAAKAFVEENDIAVIGFFKVRCITFMADQFDNTCFIMGGGEVSTMEILSSALFFSKMQKLLTVILLGTLTKAILGCWICRGQGVLERSRRYGWLSLCHHLWWRC